MSLRLVDRENYIVSKFLARLRQFIIFMTNSLHKKGRSFYFACIGWVFILSRREWECTKHGRRWKTHKKVGNNFFLFQLLLSSTWVSSGILWIIVQLPSSNPFLLKLLDKGRLLLINVFANIKFHYKIFGRFHMRSSA